MIIDPKEIDSSVINPSLLSLRRLNLLHPLAKLPLRVEASRRANHRGVDPFTTNSTDAPRHAKRKVGRGNTRLNYPFRDVASSPYDIELQLAIPQSSEK